MSTTMHRFSTRIPLLASVQLGLALLGLQALGCDAGKKAFDQAASLESQGKSIEAAQAYDQVCTNASASKVCPVARQRAAEVRWNYAVNSLQEGKIQEMRAALDSFGKDSPIASQAAILAEHPEAKAALAFNEATTASDPTVKNQKLEALSHEPTSFAPKARELLKQQPDALLQAVKDACKPSGAGSCSAAVERLSTAMPDSFQAKEALELSKAELVRLYPVLDKLEKLLIQRLESYNAKALRDLCEQEGDASCGDLKGGVNEGFLKTAFTKQLEELPDPELKKAFDARWERVGSTGEYDPEPWPKPSKK